MCDQSIQHRAHRYRIPHHTTPHMTQEQEAHTGSHYVLAEFCPLLLRLSPFLFYFGGLSIHIPIGRDKGGGVVYIIVACAPFFSFLFSLSGFEGDVSAPVRKVTSALMRYPFSPFWTYGLWILVDRWTDGRTNPSVIDQVHSSTSTFMRYRV